MGHLTEIPDELLAKCPHPDCPSNQVAEVNREAIVKPEEVAFLLAALGESV